MALKERLQQLLPRLIGAGLNIVALPAPRYAGKKAVDIFSTPRRGRLRPRETDFLNHFAQERLSCDGLQIQCYLKGQGDPKILFLHGWESNAARWQHLMRKFEAAGNCMLIAIDAPAHGASDGTRFNSLLYGRCIAAACAQFQPDIIIGHSIGAASLVYACTHLDMPAAKQLVLMGSPSDFLDIVDNYIQMLRMSKRTVRAMMRQFEQRFNMAPGYYSISEFVKQLTVPGMVVHDQNDLVSPMANGEKIAANWSGSRLIATKGLGHSLNGDAVLESIVADVLEGSSRV